MNSYTEKEAANLWCPFSSVSHRNGTSCNRSLCDEGPARYSFCMGSKCMAWQWSDCGHEPIPPQDSNDPFDTGSYKIGPNSKGYCGIARQS